ncbi:hypothetical protein B0A52_03178 [Exophiala mesophila]|uniref:Peptidase C45 hydrolase domain-containing protein n=1 Tax=Exophiala mesophila TaxID=212818 RepID=A0A438NAM9_EXOME|nr:hypothetical protein B0A52_03178 [Exophiala mesophila]
MFQKASAMDWDEVRCVAQTFETKVERKWPDYLEEMKGLEAQFSSRSPPSNISQSPFYSPDREHTGVADGAGVSLLDILALNWEIPQQENLIVLEIRQLDKPTIQMVTEAGMIGKIGFNSAGVGVCMNAIRTKGVDLDRLPVHLGMRMVLEKSTARDALESLKQSGLLAGPVHLLISDAHESYGWVVDTVWLSDSPFRVERMRELTDAVEDPSWTDVHSFFTDRKNAPAAICRVGENSTLFNIIMDLKRREAVVRLGFPDAPVERLELKLPGEKNLPHIQLADPFKVWTKDTGTLDHDGSDSRTTMGASSQTSIVLSIKYTKGGSYNIRTISSRIANGYPQTE